MQKRKNKHPSNVVVEFWLLFLSSGAILTCMCLSNQNYCTTRTHIGCSKEHTREEARTAVSGVFTRVTFASLLKRAVKPAATIGSVVQVAATHDKYVHDYECEQLYRSLQAAVVLPDNGVDGSGESGSSAGNDHAGDGAGSNVSEVRIAPLQWLPGGHATAFLWQKDYFVPYCVQAARTGQAAWDKWVEETL